MKSRSISLKKRINSKTILLLIIVAAIVIPLGFILASNDSGETNPCGSSGDNCYTTITVDEAYSMINDNVQYPNLVVLDVRTDSEYAAGHIPDTMHIPLDQLEGRLGELEQYMNTEIVVYCHSGSRSQTASEILVEHSFSKVFNMAGGFNDWINAGYPSSLL